MFKTIFRKLNYFPRVMNLISFLYSFRFNIQSLKFRYNNKIGFDRAFIRNTHLKIVGQNNTLLINNNSRLYNCRIFIKGDNCKIEISENCILFNLELWVEDNEGCILINNSVTVGGGHFAVTEGKSILIEEDCMLSKNIEIRTGDSHSIYSLENKQKINCAEKVIIGSHVWIGANATILKGSLIGANSIIGTGSIVTKKCISPNTIYAGVPAKAVKYNIEWKRIRNS